MPPVGTVGAILRRALEDARYQEHERPIPLYSLPKPSAGPFRLRVLTLNVWGLPFVSGSLEERIDAICEHVRSSRFDLIGFQEAFHPRERDKLRNAASASGLVYQHVFRMGVGIPIWPQSGSTGLCVVSRYPIVQAAFHRYVVNGKIHKLYHGDYVAAKGVGLVRVCTPAGPVDVYISHLHSCYETFQGRDDWDEYKPTRVAQGFELARFVQHTRRSPLAVLMGDLNSAPDDQVLDLLRVAGHLRDAFAECNPRAAGYTYGAINNSWGPNGAGGPVEAAAPHAPALPSHSASGGDGGSSSRRGQGHGRGRGRSRSEDAVSVPLVDEEEGRASAWADSDVDPEATHTLQDRPTRMDYILFSAARDGAALGDVGSEGGEASPEEDGATHYLSSGGGGSSVGWSVRSCRIVRWRTPAGVSVSDHFGVAATFAFDAAGATAYPAPPAATACAVPRLATAGVGAGDRSDASPPVLMASHAAAPAQVRSADSGAAPSPDHGLGVDIATSPDRASVACGDGSPTSARGVASSARRLTAGAGWEVHPKLPPAAHAQRAVQRGGGGSLPALSAAPLVAGLDREVSVLRECQAIIVSGLSDAQRRKGGHARRAWRAILVMAAYGLVLAATAVAGSGAAGGGGDVVVTARGAEVHMPGGVGPATPPNPAPAPAGGDLVNSAASTALSALALVVPILGAYATVELLLCWFAVGDEISGFEEVREQMEVCSVYRRALRSAASAS